MKKKFLLPILIISGVLSLTSCSLFNDDDIAVKNEYDPISYDVDDDPLAPHAGGVTGKTSDAVPNSVVYKNIGYHTDGKIINTYKVGGINHLEYNINSGNDYEATTQSNNYDLYVPNTASRTNKHTVILFIHGGAWVSGFKTDVNPYIYEFANKGYVTATLKYSLLKRTMDDTSLSIFRNLDEIDACINSIKNVLTEIGFDTSKTELVIGGASSGAHLAMLYSYSRGKRSSLPIKFIVDAVGPVDIKDDNWRCFNNASDAVLDAGLGKEAISIQKTAGNLGDLTIAGEGGKSWTDYQVMRIANGMCGLPFDLETVKAATDENENYIVDFNNPAYLSMTKADGGEDQLSVTYWINKADNESKFPIICAYAGKDTIVGIAQYAKLQTALDAKGITYYSSTSSYTGNTEGYIYFRNSGHSDLTKQKDEEHYNEIISAVTSWIEA